MCLRIPQWLLSRQFGFINGLANWTPGPGTSIDHTPYAWFSNFFLQVISVGPLTNGSYQMIEDANYESNFTYHPRKRRTLGMWNPRTGFQPVYDCHPKFLYFETRRDMREVTLVVNRQKIPPYLVSFSYVRPHSIFRILSCLKYTPFVTRLGVVKYQIWWKMFSVFFAEYCWFTKLNR